MKTIGIVMAGGKGTRLKPLTDIINKHLVPVYNKPMIFYSISTLIYSGIKEILIICNDGDEFSFNKSLSDVIKRNNIKIYYASQKNIGGGIAEGLIIAKDLIQDCNKIVFILGDNFFYGRLFPQLIQNYLNKKDKNSTVFLSKVSNPQDYGVAYFKNKKLNKIVEKPKNPSSDMAVTGLYIYHQNVLKIINDIKPSKRNELEITSVNNHLLKIKQLNCVDIGRGTVWFDLGTFENIYLCSEYVRLMEQRQGLKISNI